MDARRQRWGSEAGFSLSEMLVVTGIMSVLTATAVFQIGQSRPAALGDGAMRVVLSQMNAARERAITERRQMRLTFTNNTVTVIREEIPGPTLTTLSAIPFEGGVQFLVIAGVGDIPAPDNIGFSTALVFPTATGTPPEVKFSSEGTFINQDGLPLNGTIFVALPNQKASARGVSIFGATGRIRAYRFNGRDWKPV
jgi:prepilin-type N-terminal cleavage/methylation domain-containing protein